MSRTVLALVLVAASATTASAGGFIGLGIGTAPATSGDIEFYEDGRSGRLMLGYRFGRISVEGIGMRHDMVRSDGHLYTATNLALAGRYNFPLGDRFEVFGRAGLVRTDLDDEFSEPYSGNGFLVGAGAEFRIPLGVTSLSFFVDYTILRNGSLTTDLISYEYALTSRVWTLGAMVSF